MSDHNPAQDTAEYIPFEEFRNGLPHGRFHVVVNPSLVVAFVAYITHATPVALALIGPGIGLALMGYAVVGVVLVVTGVVLRRVVHRQAARVLLHLASRVPSVYEQATEHGVMEVRRA